jgi:hypothetical protein
MLTRRIAAVALTLFALLPAIVSAHRLDECLQATRIAIDPARVTIELDVTPGASTASQVRTWMDDRDRFAGGLVRSLSASLDGQAVPIELTSSAFPESREFDSGNGMIRVRAIGRLPQLAAGHHQLSYTNANEPAPSVYLANALVPSDASVRITGQMRDADQRRLTIDFAIAPARRLSSVSVAAFALATALIPLAVVASAFRRKMRPGVGLAKAG